jgi:hypothetical protein
VGGAHSIIPMAVVLPQEAAEALDWRLAVMQTLLLRGCSNLPARQAAAEAIARRVCHRWRYQDELCALKALDVNRRRERMHKGGLLALMPLRATTVAKVTAPA